MMRAYGVNVWRFPDFFIMAHMGGKFAGPRHLFPEAACGGFHTSGALSRRSAVHNNFTGYPPIYHVCFAALLRCLSVPFMAMGTSESDR